MIYNTKFTFKNIRGTYTILPEEQDHPVFGKMRFSSKIIYPSYEHGLNNVYSLEDDTFSSVALEFVNMNEQDESQVLSFCNTYGLPITNRTIANDRNDYLFMDIKKEDFSQLVPERHVEEYRLNDFKTDVIFMRALIKLIVAIREMDYYTMLQSIIFFTLNDFVKYDDDYIPLTETGRFNYYYSLFSEDLDLEGLKEDDPDPCEDDYEDTTINRLRYFMEAVNDDLYRAETVPDGYHYTTDYDDIYHTTWQYLFSLFEKLINNASDISISEDGDVSVAFKDGAINQEDLDSYLPGKFTQLGNAIVSDIFRDSLEGIQPELHYEDGQLTPNWKISTLYDAMYLELFFKMHHGLEIRKCANPTCGKFFVASSDNKKKIYCSTKCAQVMAKRKQREREKLQN